MNKNTVYNNLIIQTSKGIACAILIFILLAFSFDKSLIMSGSMEPTLMTGDIVIFVNDIFTGVDRGDIIEFEHDGQILSKRVIAMEGDHLTFLDGYAYLNGEKIDSDSYTMTTASTYPGLTAEYTVPNDCVFVMGDNRLNSLDSRFWEEPFVSLQDVKAVYFLTLP